MVAAGVLKDDNYFLDAEGKLRWKWGNGKAKAEETPEKEGTPSTKRKRKVNQKYSDADEEIHEDIIEGTLLLIVLILNWNRS